MYALLKINTDSETCFPTAQFESKLNKRSECKGQDKKNVLCIVLLTFDFRIMP